jgi:hypothetical protein
MNAQKVNTNGGNYGTNPDDTVNAAFQKNAHYRHNDYVQGRDETGFPHRCIHNTNLLQGSRNTNNSSANNSRENQVFFCPPWVSPLFCRPGAQNCYRGKNNAA